VADTELCIVICGMLDVYVDTGAGVADALPRQQAFYYYWSSL